MFGAYTLLFAGLSEEAEKVGDGEWGELSSSESLSMRLTNEVVPWGRIMKIRGNLAEASKAKTEDGTGIARSFWEWNEEQVKSFL